MLVVLTLALPSLCGLSTSPSPPPFLSRFSFRLGAVVVWFGHPFDLGVGYFHVRLLRVLFVQCPAFSFRNNLHVPASADLPTVLLMLGFAANGAAVNGAMVPVLRCGRWRDLVI